MKKKKTKWHKKCPSCGKTQYYRDKSGLNEAIRNDRLCKSCACKGRHFSEEHKKKLSEANKGKYHSKESKKKMNESTKEYYKTHDGPNKGKHFPEETRRKISEGNKGKRLSEETKKKISEGNKGKHLSKETKRKIGEGNKGKYVSKEIKKKMGEGNKGKHVSEETKKKLSKDKKEYYKTHDSYWEGKHHSKETIKKIRLSHIKNIENRHGQCFPNYNQDACKILEKINNKYNLNLRHAENGGEYHIKELGYWPDAIDFDNKFIVEFDEKYHYENGKLSKKDINRQKEIEEMYPTFEFVRIKMF